MSTINVETGRNISRKLCFLTLKNFIPTMPKHVVFLVNEVPKFYDESEYFDENKYQQNFENILQSANWCVELEIPEMSVYVFSSRTFKFPLDTEEKMKAAFQTVIEGWLEDCEQHRTGRNLIRINIVDRAETLASTTLSTCEKLMHLTEKNVVTTVNIVIGYLDVDTVINVMGRFENTLNLHNREDFYRSLYNYHLHEPQLIISNCKHRRLSDYLIWKIPRRCIHYVHVLWYEFSWWHFIMCLIYFWRHQSKL